MNQIITEIEKSQIKSKRPELHVGDIVRLEQKLEGVAKKTGKNKKQAKSESQEGKGGSRRSIFEGVVIKIRNPKTIKATVTLRKISFGVGVEKVFSLYSPLVSKIDVLKRSKVRRSKLYYLRGLTGKKAKMQDKNTDVETLRDLGWDEQEIKKQEELQKESAEEASKAVEEGLKSEDKAEVTEEKPETESTEEKKPEEDKDSTHSTSSHSSLSDEASSTSESKTGLEGDSSEQKKE